MKKQSNIKRVFSRPAIDLDEIEELKQAPSTNENQNELSRIEKINRGGLDLKEILIDAKMDSDKSTVFDIQDSIRREVYQENYNKLWADQLSERLEDFVMDSGDEDSKGSQQDNIAVAQNFCMMQQKD